MVKTKLFSALLVTALAIAALPASAAAAKAIPVDISIRVDPNPPRGTVPYVGKLRSEKRACENFRVVTLWRITEGFDIKESQGTFETNAAGKWAIDSQVNPDGEYFATTPKFTLPSGKVCKRGRSESIIRDENPRAAPEKFKTEVTLKVEMGVTPPRSRRGTFRWHGKVKSENEKCENKRFVTLWTEPLGGGVPSSRGEDLTGPDGKWAVFVDANTEGEWYAEADKKTLGNGNICKSARSNVIIRDLSP
jgi:hypothetical protein